MKIVIDRNNILTRADSRNDKEILSLDENIEVIQTPIDLFKKYNFPDNIQIDTKFDRWDISTILYMYQDLRNHLLNNIECQKIVNQYFLIALQLSTANFEDINIQKITYKLDIDENIDDIVDTIKGIKSNALLRAIEYDKDNNTIVSYSSREGIWEIEGEFFAKAIEMRSIGAIRTDRALRSVREPTKFINRRRINYHLFEDTRELIENDIIKYSYCTREQPDHSYRDDTKTVYVTKLHYKTEELTTEDLQELYIAVDVDKALIEETTHINKQQATLAQMNQSLENNKKEIHTKYNEIKVISNNSLDKKLKEQKESVIAEYLRRLADELEEKQLRERAELEKKISIAFDETHRQKVKQILINSLTSGMTLVEALDNLKAAKYSNVIIQTVLEELKTDMILSVKKDELIAHKDKKIQKLTQDLEMATKKANEFERKNNFNYKNYTIELEKRKKADETIYSMKNYIDQFKSTIEKKNIEIYDLQKELENKERETNALTKELDEQFNKLQEQEKLLKYQNEQIETLLLRVAKMEERLNIVGDLNKKIDLLCSQNK